jgi:Phage tail-collar fibre protein
LAASNTGLSCQISHIALGAGQGGAVPGYAPSAAQTTLFSEFLRAPVAGGDRIDATTILIQAAFDPVGPSWAHEIGVFLSDGTLLAVHSSTIGPLTYVQAGQQIVYALALGLAALPAGSVTWNASGPSVNVTMAEPFADLATAVAGLQARFMAIERIKILPLLQTIALGA